MKPQIEIIYQDDNIIVVNKPSGMIVIPDQHTYENKTLVGILKKQLNQKIWVVHRIDRDTTGVLVFAKNAEAHRNLSMQFEHSQVQKKYSVLLSGVLEDDEGIINKPILIDDREVTISENGKESVTDFKVLERFKNYTFVEAMPKTGRRHQIRVHFWSLGHPLAIDAEYGSGEPLLLSSIKRKYKAKDDEKEKPLIDRLTLHAAELTVGMPGIAVKDEAFNPDCRAAGAPGNDGKVTFKAPLPKDFEITLKQLRKYGK
ncbi:MAG: RluA family pseudouridine synthase [Endomicrobium sp.]|jgi:23S rRNA pseudouridine955/2504/2580 synthase/23S rRNA pseudouridine1911/1915/1917 synthase|nr:RluA family pseudouridine synthase [Endomicrobium sp.]